MLIYYAIATVSWLIIIFFFVFLSLVFDVFFTIVSYILLSYAEYFLFLHSLHSPTFSSPL